MEFVDKKINRALEAEIAANEITTSNLYKRLTDDKTCAIISPYRSEYTEEENRVRMVKLKSQIRKLGLGFSEFISRWVEDGKAYDERSLLVTGISKEQAIKLGREFNQSSIIFKDKNDCVEICINKFESFSPGDIVREFNISSDHILNLSEAKEIFARKKGGSASKPIKRGGNREFVLKEKPAEESFELYEVEQPRPSYFQNREFHKKIF